MWIYLVLGFHPNHNSIGVMGLDLEETNLLSTLQYLGLIPKGM